MFIFIFQREKDHSLTEINVFTEIPYIRNGVINNKYYTYSEYFIHPSYDPNNEFSEKVRNNDMALIRLKEDINFKDRTLVNSICLPKKNIYNNETEYGVISGYGATVGQSGQLASALQIGWNKIFGINSGNDMLWENRTHSYLWVNKTDPLLVVSSDLETLPNGSHIIGPNNSAPCPVNILFE